MLATSALALEAAVAALLLRAGPAASAAMMVAAAAAHVAAIVCFVALLGRRAARLHIEAAEPAARLLFATVSAVLPVVGPLALLTLLGRMGRDGGLPDAALAYTALTPPAFAAPGGSEVFADIGAGSLEARLRFDPAPESRVAAVLATRRLRAPADAVRLLRLAVRDSSEEVRLLAHALLEDRDRRAYAAIGELTRELADAPVERRGPIAYLLAEASLELCTGGLVTGELESFTLGRARALTEEARASAPIRGSATAALLLGRVLLRQGEAGAARAAFDESRRLGAPDALLAPYLAQVAFEVAFENRETAASVEGRA